ncbi:hypothetical protein [Hymenobacter arcticus]
MDGLELQVADGHLQQRVEGVAGIVVRKIEQVGQLGFQNAWPARRGVGRGAGVGGGAALLDVGEGPGRVQAIVGLLQPAAHPHEVLLVEARPGAQVVVAGPERLVAAQRLLHGPAAGRRRKGLLAEGPV